jgi:uncharacterized protein (DUF1778 family)
MASEKKKNQRQFREYETIELRLRPAELRRIKQAAELRGESVSEFIISSVCEAADKITESAGSWALTATDSKILVGVLRNPPKPNPHMIAAFRSHKARVQSL